MNPARASNWRGRHLADNPLCERCALTGRSVEAMAVSDRPKRGPNGERYESLCEVCFRNDRMALEAIEHAGRARQAERRLLSAGCNYPLELWDACADAGVDHTSFADVRCRKLFDVLTACVVLDIEPNPWLVGQEMEALGYPFIGNGLRDLWLLETTPAGLQTWGMQVAFYAGRRMQYHSLLAEARDRIGDIADDATTTPTAQREAAA